MSTAPAVGAAYQTLIAGRELIAVDIETTTVPTPGKRERTTYPISVGAAVWLNGTRRDTFHTLMDPGVPVDDASSTYNGITTADLAGAPDVPTALAAFDDFLATHPDAILVCHNARFDIGHLATAYTAAGMTLPDRLVLDTQFLPVRLQLPGASARSKLSKLVAEYSAATTLSQIPSRQRRLHKALKDAQDTAAVAGHLLAQAAAKGITDFDDLLATGKATRTTDLADAGSNPRSQRPVPAPMTRAHIRACHHRRGLPGKTGKATVDAWVDQVGQCVSAHCPHLVEKAIVEADRAALLAPLTALLAACASPGDAGTLLGALEPFLFRLDRHQARDWYKANHTLIKAAPSCAWEQACPSCVNGHPCPQDTTVLLLTRRALDYGTTRTGKPVSLFSRQVKDDLWDRGRHRKMDTWPRQGMPEMAAHMMWILIEAARSQRLDTRRLDILDKAVARGLHEHDPRLALEVARHWERDPTLEPDIENLVTLMRTQATTDPGYLALAMWFDGPHQRVLVARTAAAHRKARPVPKGLRKPAAVELRPDQVKHRYRYQVCRSDTVRHASLPAQNSSDGR